MSVDENLKNAFYTSVGFALKGKEKIEEAAKDFAEKNKLSAEEGENFVKDILGRFEKKQNEAESFIKEKVNELIERNKINVEEAESFVVDIMAGFEKKNNEVQDYVKEKVNDFSIKNKLSAEEGEKFIKEVMVGFEKTQNGAQDFIRSAVQKVVGELGLVGRKEYDDLHKKYEELKAKLDEK